MRVYIKEMTDAWSSEGAQAAYVLGAQLLETIQKKIEYLERQASAIRAVGSILQDDPEVDTSADPVEPTGDLDCIEPGERSRIIVETANELVEINQNNVFGSDNGLIGTREVLEHIRQKGLDLGVKQPSAVIGTVLASAEGFQKVARNTFEVVPPQNDFDPDDLPF